jgi:hypothetical protein
MDINHDTLESAFARRFSAAHTARARQGMERAHSGKSTFSPSHVCARRDAPMHGDDASARGVARRARSSAPRAIDIARVDVSGGGGGRRRRCG